MAQYYKQEKREPMSMFVPLPLEFLQGQMDKKQERYDAAKDLEAQAYDAFMSRQTTHPSDEQYKQEITNKQFQEMMDNINETYKGDAGSALNYMKSKITETKQDPFWNALNTKEMMQKREADFIEKHPAGSYWNFGSKTAEPVVTKDANGNVTIKQRPEDFDFRYIPKQPYDKIAREMMDNIAVGLREGDLQRLAQFGVLGSTSISELTEEQIARLAEAKTPGFSGMTPEMLEAIEKGLWDGQQRDPNATVSEVEVKYKNKPGTFMYKLDKGNEMTPAQAEQFKFLYNQGIEQAVRKEQKQYMGDALAAEARKKAADKEEAGNYNFSSSVVFNAYGPDDGPKGAYTKHNTNISEYEKEIKEVQRRIQNDFVLDPETNQYYKPRTVLPTEAQSYTPEQFKKTFKELNQVVYDANGNASTRKVWINKDEPTQLMEEDNAVLSNLQYDQQKLKETNSLILERAAQLNPNLNYELVKDSNGLEQAVIVPKELKNATPEQKLTYYKTNQTLSSLSDLIPNLASSALMDGEDFEVMKGNINKVNALMQELKTKVDNKEEGYNIGILPIKEQTRIMSAIPDLTAAVFTATKAIAEVENLKANAIILNKNAGAIPWDIVLAPANVLASKYFNGSLQNKVADATFKTALDDATYEVYGSRTKQYNASIPFDEVGTNQKPIDSHLKIRNTINEELKYAGRTLMDKSGRKITNYKKEFKDATYNPTKYFWTPELGWMTELMPIDKEGKPLSEEPVYYKTPYWGQLLDQEDSKKAAALAMAAGLENSLLREGQNVKFKVKDKGYKLVRRDDRYGNSYELYSGKSHKAYTSPFEAVYEGIANGNLTK